MFEPYTGPWTFEHAAHLIRRTTFGPTKERIQQAVDEGLDGALDTLFSADPDYDPPVYYDYDADPDAGIGETWVDLPVNVNLVESELARARSLNGWWYKRMRFNTQTITEKLTLFWHNHFVINGSGPRNINWWYLQKLIALGKGSFKEFTKQITVDKGMLIYLTGFQSSGEEPNENFARELLELFTIGKGDLVAPGDYTNYTEQDVTAIAAALTGWRLNTVNTDPNAYFVPTLHDQGTKQLSHRFNNAVIQNADEDEYKNVIDIIFQQDEVAHFICRRLYIWFVNFELTPEVEAGVITPMANILLDNDYEIRPALIALLKSSHFYDMSVRGCIIKSHIDYFLSIHGSFQIDVPSDWIKELVMYNAWFNNFRDLGMAPFYIPSVAGWKAYYQSPGFYKEWINSVTMSVRKRTISNAPFLSTWADETLPGYDWIKYISTLNNPLDPNDMIDEICQIIFPRQMSDTHKSYFKDILLNGLPDFEWTDEYGAFLADPTNEGLRLVLENKLDLLFRGMMAVPEFQLS